MENSLSKILPEPIKAVTFEDSNFYNSQTNYIINQSDCELIIDEEELKNLFPQIETINKNENIIKSNRPTEDIPIHTDSCLDYENEEIQLKQKNITTNLSSEINFGPKLFFKPTTLNYTCDSVEQQIYDRSINKKFNSNYNSEDKENEEYEYSVNSEDLEIKVSHMSIKIENYENQIENNTNNLKNIYTYNFTQTSGKDYNTNMKNTNCFACTTNKSLRKKVTKSTNNTSLYSIGNNNNTHTKRSTNISIKSLKLNDSLSKLRKRRSSLAKEELENINKINKKKLECRCVIF